MNKIITAGCMALAATTALAMPNKQELAKAKPLVEAQTKADLAAYKAGEKTAQKVAAAHIAYAQKAEGEAAKYLLLQGAFKLYARCGEYDLAAEAIGAMKREIKDLPPAVIVEIVSDELRYVSDGKAPRLVALLKEAKGAMSVPESKAADGAVTNDTKLNYEVKGDGIVIGGVWKLAVPTNTTGALVVPETIKGKPVREIGFGAFAGCRGITAVTIPSSVKTIWAHAFRGCTGLESVVIPEGVTMIDAQAFDGCSKLKSLTLPQSMKVIRGYSFRGCNALTSVTIPASVAIIEEGAFDGCTGLKTVMLQSGVKNIGPLAFRNCSKLSAVKISEDVTSIGANAFDGCKSLTALIIPASVTNFCGQPPFEHCNALKSVRVAEGNQHYKCENGLLLTKDGTELVQGFNVTGDVKIPEGVTRIRLGAFVNCGDWVKSVVFPSTIKDLGSWTFANCGGIKSVTLPECVTNIGGGVFYGAGIKSVTVPSSVKSIGRQAFARCHDLESVTLSSGVTNIASSAFDVCERLKSFYVDSANRCFSSRNGMLLSKDGATLVVGVNGDVKIPDGVKSIATGAFSGFGGLKTLAIPASVKKIDKNALRYAGDYCGQLTTVTMLGERPDCPEGTFNKCGNLKEIHVPTNAKSWAGMTEWQGKKLVFDAKTE